MCEVGYEWGQASANEGERKQVRKGAGACKQAGRPERRASKPN